MVTIERTWQSDVWVDGVDTHAIAAASETEVPGKPVAEAQVAPPRAQNLDFERGQPGRSPEGWEVPDDHPDQVTIDATDKAYEGRHSVLMAPAGALRFSQTFDASDYRDRRIRVSVAFRVAGDVRTVLRLEFQRPPGMQPWQAAGGSKGATVGGWYRQGLVADVPWDATGLTLFLSATGNGRAWADDVQIEVLGTVPEREPPN
jgi:hypothetical protein